MKTLHKILFLALLILVQSCSDDSEDESSDPTMGMTKVISAAVPDSEYKVIMYIEDGKDLEVGYNEFSLGLYTKDGEWLSQSHLSITPMMEMSEMNMMHSAPFEIEDHDMSMDMMQKFATVFVMPSTAGSWTLNVNVTESDTDFEGTVVLPVTVTSPKLTRMLSVTSDAGSYFISLLGADTYEVGVNDFEMTIHQKESMMDWPAVENLTVTIEPEMPAMGHGSPNNVNPKHDEKGHYMGEVNFTMTGEWLINVTVKDGKTVIAETAFEIVL